jgi:hypothetical protein
MLGQNAHPEIDLFPGVMRFNPNLCADHGDDSGLIHWKILERFNE